MIPRRFPVRRVGWRLVASASLAVLVAAAPASAQEVGYTGSVYVTHGTYTVDADAKTSVYLFNSVDLTSGPFRAAVSVPWVRQTTSGFTTDPLTGAVQELTQTTTGFADPLIRVDVRLLDDRAHGLQIGAAGSVKLPVVDVDTGRGTGEADFAGGGTIFKTFAGTSVFGDVLFWKYGDPEGVDFEDMLSYSIGLGQVLGNGRWSTMISLSGFSQGLAGAAAPVQLNVALLTLPARFQSFAITGGFGLNDTSGGLSIGTSWRIAR
jgi:hypothetical protein